MVKQSLQKILVAVDGSSQSDEAARYALDLARLADADVSFAHVIEDIKMAGVIGARAKYGDVKLVDGYVRARKESAAKWMKEYEADAERRGIKSIGEILVSDGESVASAIIDYAKKNQVDLIVLGTRGHSRFKRLVLGSIASGVSSYAHCPVLVVR
jgi:nucleotide-binding universal stress UspA family protein